MTTGDSVEPMETAVHVDEKELTNAQKTVDGENGHPGGVEDPDDDDDYKPESTFRYEVKQLSKMKVGGSQLSPSSMVRGLPWKIMAMCRETNRGPKTLGFFLQCNAESDSPSWSCNASATLRMLSQKEGIPDYERKISHVFFPKENDWGFSNFMQWDSVLDAEKGFLKDDTIILEVEVRADAPHGVQWDSKKHTGYVGLKNQGATCYMNSLLQTLFFTNKLRKAVYQMPTESDDPMKSVALAMQRVFYELQFSDRPVGTKKLTRSFGWETFDSFLQHDVQELNRVLLDNLESKMKATPVEGTIPKLFEGKMKSYVRCKSVPFESKREEPFYDIQLNVKGQPNIFESFKDYIAVEMLEGDNKYDAGDYGMQEAEKGVIFLKFPPVLHLQLMRFTYDPQHDQNVKINDRFEFPEKLKLDEFLEAPESTPATYTLHAVLVHSGDFHGGHYVVYINPKGNGKWCKFDDDVVSRCTKQEAIEANYGGNDSDLPSRQCTNAYMLVYIRDSMLDDILHYVMDVDIPASLKLRLQDEREQEAMKKKEKSEAHLYATVHLIMEDCFEGHQGFDLIDFESEHKLIRKLRVRKAILISELYEILGQQQNLKPFIQFRLWVFRGRPDGATRPFYLKPSDLAFSIGHLLQHVDPELQFFVEIIDFSKGEKELRPYDAEKETMVFLKYYSPENRRIVYCGHVFMPDTLTPVFLEQLKAEMRRRAGLPSDAKLMIFLEDSPSRIEHVENCVSLTTLLGPDVLDGVILVFQLAAPAGATGHEIPTVKEYFRELSNRIEIELVDKMEPTAEPIIITASLRWNYGTLAEAVGKQLNYDPYKIQFYKPHLYKDVAGPLIKWNLDMTLKELSGSQHRNRGTRGRLYFQKVPLRVDELEYKLQLRLSWMDSRMKVDELTVYPDKDGTVKSLLEEVRKQEQLPEGGSGKLRLLVINNSRVANVVSNDQPLDQVIANQQYRAEEIPIDQLVVDPKMECLLPVAHFHKDHFQTFGTPFLIKVRHGEPFTSVKARLQKVLEVSDKDFEKYKFALCTATKCSYFDNDNFSINLNDLSVGGPHVAMPSRPWLGLEHVNKAPKSRGAFPMEKAIIIHN